ncbi:MAG: hypothetical protein ACOVQT_07745 [Rubrivivax sp.]|jgi:hypothetical protein
MHLVALGWIYVVGMMALVEAFGPNGTVLGAVFTFLLYGVLPLSIVIYIMATPTRRKVRALREAEEEKAAAAAKPHSGQPDDGSHHAASAAVPTVGKEP